MTFTSVLTIFWKFVRIEFWIKSNSIYNYKVKPAVLREVVRLFIFSQIWRGDKIVCVKRPGVWRMTHISRWHLCYNGSFTSRLDMTPQSKKYLFKIECPDRSTSDGQTIPYSLASLDGCDFVTWAKGIIFQAVSIIS